MEIPLVKGRFFTDFDTAPNAQPVVIIDEKFAQRFWPNGDADRQARLERSQAPLTIVGVVGTVKQYGLDIDGRIVVYRPSPGLLSLACRAHGRPIPAAVARAIVRGDSGGRSDHPGFDVRTMTDRMRDSMARQRFSTHHAGRVRRVRAACSR